MKYYMEYPVGTQVLYKTGRVYYTLVAYNDPDLVHVKWREHGEDTWPYTWFYGGAEISQGMTVRVPRKQIIKELYGYT